MPKARRFVRQYAKGRDCILVDSHLSHDVGASVIVVLRCRPDVLGKRLKKRGWPIAKIRENVEAERIGVISSEAKGKVFEIDTTSLAPAAAAAAMERVLKGKGKRYKGSIDWIERKG
jgi:adenylate kinase